MITELSEKNEGTVTKDEISILYEDMDKAVLKRMPYWFKSLRKAYMKKACVILL